MARKLERIADKVTSILELIKELNGNRALISPVTDRFTGRKEVLQNPQGLYKQNYDTRKTRATATALRRRFKRKKFRLSEVIKIVEGKA